VCWDNGPAIGVRVAQLAVLVDRGGVAPRIYDPHDMEPFAHVDRILKVAPTAAASSGVENVEADAIVARTRWSAPTVHPERPFLSSRLPLPQPVDELFGG
jgi:hypothetical protein